MKKALLILILIVVGCYFIDDDATSKVYSTTTRQDLGNIVFTDTPNGLLVEVNLKGLPQGEHGFHIHEFGNCEADIDETGKTIAARQAGGHYDPNKTGKHLGPDGKGHKGDLPYLNVSKSGTVQTQFYVSSLSTKEIKGRSIVIHAGGDNYKDSPLALGGGGARIACGIIE